MSCTACFQASCGFALTDRSIFDMSVDTLPLRAEGRAEDIYTSGWNFDSDTKLPLVRKRKRTPRSNVSTLEDLAQVKLGCRDCREEAKTLSHFSCSENRVVSFFIFGERRATGTMDPLSQFRTELAVACKKEKRPAESGGMHTWIQRWTDHVPNKASSYSSEAMHTCHRSFMGEYAGHVSVSSHFRANR